MKLYRAELRIVNSEIGFFSQKKLLSKKPIGNHIGGLSNEVIVIRNNNYYYPILQTLRDYFRDTRKEIQMDSFPVEEEEKLRQLIDEYYLYHYWEHKFLVVLKQFPNRVKEITTGFTFPVVKSFLDDSGIYPEWVFEQVTSANQRVYVNIIDEMHKEEIKQFATRISENDIYQRNQSLSYIIEDAQKQWRAFPPIEQVKSFISEIEFMRKLQGLKDILENKRQAELDKTEVKKYVKTIEQMRKDI